ncbi:hypothetical protein DPV78_004340 [Talaromyces pinophilus]|nr:hypothetical protein DPV78_004340 [Talaromyces pinophilus]
MNSYVIKHTNHGSCCSLQIHGVVHRFCSWSYDEAIVLGSLAGISFDRWRIERGTSYDKLLGQSKKSNMSDSSSPPRRHWKGPVGARHEHQNVWMNGGVRSTAPPAPWSGWDADRKRRESESSTKSNESRRSSGNGKALFETLHSQKRGSFSDPNNEQRKKSYAEMLPEKGFFGKWWRGYTTGSK